MKKIVLAALLFCFFLQINSNLAFAEEPKVSVTGESAVLAGAENEPATAQPVEEKKSEPPTSAPDTSAAQPESPKAPAPQAPVAEEIFIRPTDTLEVEVYNEPDLSRAAEVDNKGFITYPLIGHVKMEGLAREEAEKVVRDLLEKDYLVNPQVTIRVSRPEVPVEPKEPETQEVAPQEEVVLYSYVMLGEIHRSGTYEFNPKKGKMTLLKAVSMAGGFTNIANMGKIKMLRKSDTETKSFVVNAKDIISGKQPDVEIQADDLIVVPESLI